MKVVEDRKFPYNMTLPLSKSYGIRALFLAAVDDKEHVITPIPDAEDFQEAMRALKAVGVSFINEENSKLRVKGRRPILSNTSAECKHVYAGEGGATSRFLISFLARDNQQYQVCFHPRLYQRPNDELYNFLHSVGVKITKRDDEHSWLIQGPINIPDNDKKIDFSFKSSSQHASGILLALANKIVDNSDKYSFSTPSVGYLHMTRTMVSQFQQGKSHWNIPTDLSALPFAMAIALVNGELKIKGFSGPDDSQPDFSIFRFWEHCGGRWATNSDELTLSAPSSWPGFEIDSKKNPDLAPPLMIWAILAQTKSCFKNVSYLTYKESDRLQQMLSILDHYQISYQHEEKSDELMIFPGHPSPRKFDYACPDHRMTMTAFIMMKLFGGGNLGAEESVKKSFPAFFSQFNIDGQNHSL